MSDSDGTKIKGIVKHILWMAEILHHLGCKRKPINTGINYQPQLVGAGFFPSTVLRSSP